MKPLSDHHLRVIHQYDPDCGAKFYKCVMGDGGSDIHYGIYESAHTTMRDATKASTLRLWTIAKDGMEGDQFREVIDLGAGTGGAARVLAQLSNAHILCVDLCEHHCRDNENQANLMGMSDRIETLTSSFDHLPFDWSSRFDLAWSQEAICHAVDKLAVFTETCRVLRHGGVFVFSDIMLADDAPSDEAKAFTDVNAVVQLATVDQQIQMLQSAGFVDVTYEDWSPYLAANFERMRHQIEREYSQLVNDGVQQDFLDTFAAALSKRMAWSSGSVLRWGAFRTKKPKGVHGR